MRAIVVGLGVQGHKRRQFAGGDFVASIDPINPDADFKHYKEVPLNSFDAAILCVPDDPKIELIRYFLSNGKHILVEKPLFAEHEQDIVEIEALAQSKHLICHTAYNHRFEPHFARMKTLIDSGELGEIYRCRMFYGNGTARLVRNSAWRDQGAGVLPDLGSHLLDTVGEWFGITTDAFEIVSSHCFENASPDHVVFSSLTSKPCLEMEMTLLSWRNHFTCDIFAEKGSAHITSLCKWGPSEFIHRKRVLPSGRPLEESHTLVQPDPTWELEYAHFKNLCQSMDNPTRSAAKEGHQNAIVKTDLSRDLWISRVLKKLGNDAILQSEKNRKKKVANPSSTHSREKMAQ